MDKTNTKRNFYQLTPGKEFRQYRIEGVIGQGAMGIVYKAFDQSLQRHVALKVLQTSFIGEKEHKQFVREVKAIANLNHDNIVKLFEVGVDPTHYFTMEYIEGETLAQVIANENLSHAAITRIVSKIAMGLYHAHIKGVIHGDIKPENIMITRNREPKIMDFGLAKDHNSSQVSQSGIQGTPAYLAPEQLQNKKVDKRADIYALGVTLYRSLTGKLPFSEKNYVSLFYQIINEEPPRLRSVDNSIPVDLELICNKCMQKSPQKRYANARFLARDLQNFLVGRPLWVESSSNFMLFCKRIFYFWWLEIALVMTCLFLLFNISSSPEIPSSLNIRSSKMSDNSRKWMEPMQMRYSELNEKSVQVLQWYRTYKKRNSNNEIYHLKLLSQRHGYEPDNKFNQELYVLAKKIYRQIQINQEPLAQRVHLAIDYLETIIEILDSPLIYDEKTLFKDICQWGLGVSQLNGLTYYHKKFSDFKKLYDLQKDFTDSNRTIEIRNELERVTKTITNPFMYLSLASVNSVGNWKREPFLLCVIELEDNYRFYSKLGEYYINHYLYEEGIVLCEKALQRSPSLIRAHYNLTRAFISLEKYDKALKHIDFLKKHYDNIMKEWVYFEEVRLFLKKNDAVDAQKALNSCKLWFESKGRNTENNKDFQEWQQMIHSMTDQNFVANIRKEKEPEYYFKIGKFEEAYKVRKATQNLYLRFAIYREVIEKELRNYRQAHEIWEEANTFLLKILRDKDQTFDIRAMAYRYALIFLCTRYGKKYDKKYTSANCKHRQYLKKLQKEFTDYYFADFYMARFLKTKGNYGEAARLCNRAKKLAPWYKKEIELLQRINLARYFYYGKEENKKVDVAIKLAENLIQSDDYLPAYNLLSCIYASQSEYHDAKKAIYYSEQIRSRESVVPIIHLFDFYYDQANTYALEENYDKAIEYMENYLKIVPSFSHGINALRFFRKKKREQKLGK